MQKLAQRKSSSLKTSKKSFPRIPIQRGITEHGTVFIALKRDYGPIYESLILKLNREHLHNKTNVFLDHCTSICWFPNMFWLNIFVTENVVTDQRNKPTCHSEASRCGCVVLHLRGAVGEGAVGVVAAAAPAVPPPSMVALWPRSGGSVSRNVWAPPATSGSLWSAADPPGGPLLNHTRQSGGDQETRLKEEQTKWNVLMACEDKKQRVHLWSQD